MSKYDMREIRRFCEENNFKNVDRFRNYELFEDLAKIDERMAKVICRDILNGNESYSPLENMGDFLDRQVLLEESPETAEMNHQGFAYNSYSFGKVSENLYNRFLGICWPKTSLNNVLKAALRWAGKIKKYEDSKEFENPSDIPPCVHPVAFILTYKWDALAFRKIEEKFLEYAAQGIWFIFILVTDYGCVQIPFLPNNRNLIIEVPRYEGNDVKFEKPIIYTVNGASIGYYQTKYTFDLNKRECVIEKRSGINGIPDISTGRLSEWAIDKFKKIIIGIEIKDFNGVNVGVIDNVTMSLEMLGKHIKWDMISEQEYPFSDFAKAISTLIHGILV